MTSICVCGKEFDKARTELGDSLGTTPDESALVDEFWGSPKMNWLVVDLHLRKIWKSVGIMTFPNWMEK